MTDQFRCNCENTVCKQGHEVMGQFEQCPNEATQACSYIGGICDDCATYMPDAYLNGPLVTP